MKLVTESCLFPSSRSWSHVNVSSKRRNKMGWYLVISWQEKNVPSIDFSQRNELPSQEETIRLYKTYWVEHIGQVSIICVMCVPELCDMKCSKTFNKIFSQSWLQIIRYIRNQYITCFLSQLNVPSSIEMSVSETESCCKPLGNAMDWRMLITETHSFKLM